MVTDQELLERLERLYPRFEDLVAEPEIQVEYHCPCMLEGKIGCEVFPPSEEKDWRPLSTERAQDLVWNCYFSRSLPSSSVPALNSLRKTILHTSIILNIEYLFRRGNLFKEWVDRLSEYQWSGPKKRSSRSGESPETRIGRRRRSALRKFHMRRDAVGPFRHVKDDGAWYYYQHRHHLEFTRIAATGSYHFPDMDWIGKRGHKGFTEIGPTSSGLSFMEGFRDPYDLRVWVLDLGWEIIFGGHLSRAVFQYVEGLIGVEDHMGKPVVRE